MANKNKKRIKSFLEDIPEWWEEAWQGMPEYIQEDLAPYKSVYVHFKNEKDMKAFEKLMNQKISFKTKSIWYPEVKRRNLSEKRYVDEVDGES